MQSTATGLWPEFPAGREFRREFFEKKNICANYRFQNVCNIRRLHSGFPAQKNMEFFARACRQLDPDVTHDTANCMTHSPTSIRRRQDAGAARKRSPDLINTPWACQMTWGVGTESVGLKTFGPSTNS